MESGDWIEEVNLEMVIGCDGQHSHLAIEEVEETGFFDDEAIGGAGDLD